MTNSHKDAKEVGMGGSEKEKRNVAINMDLNIDVGKNEIKKIG